MTPFLSLDLLLLWDIAAENCGGGQLFPKEAAFLHLHRPRAQQLQLLPCPSGCLSFRASACLTSYMTQPHSFSSLGGSGGLSCRNSRGGHTASLEVWGAEVTCGLGFRMQR